MSTKKTTSPVKQNASNKEVETKMEWLLKTFDIELEYYINYIKTIEDGLFRLKSREMSAPNPIEKDSPEPTALGHMETNLNRLSELNNRLLNCKIHLEEII